MGPGVRTETRQDRKTQQIYIGMRRNWNSERNTQREMSTSEPAIQSAAKQGALVLSCIELCSVLETRRDEVWSLSHHPHCPCHSDKKKCTQMSNFFKLKNI